MLVHTCAPFLGARHVKIQIVSVHPNNDIPVLITFDNLVATGIHIQLAPYCMTYILEWLLNNMGHIIWAIWIRYHVMLSNLHVPFSYIFWFLYEIKLEWVLSFGWVEELNKWKSQYVSSQNLSMGKDTIWNIYTIYYIIIYISPSISTLMQLNNSQNGIITTLKPTNSFIFTFSPKNLPI